MSSATPAPGALAMPTLPACHARIRPGDAERRVGAERLGVEEQVVDAAVDDVDALEAVDRAHVDAVVVADDQVAALDERRAHPLGEERVLEVRRVEDAGRQHGDRRVADALGRERHEQLVQLVGVGVDRRRCSCWANSSGNARLAIGAVLDHVADAATARAGCPRARRSCRRRRARGRCREMCAHTPNFGCDALALRAEVHRVVEQVGREHAVGDDPLVVVEVVDEEVERAAAAASRPRSIRRPLAGLR